MVTQERLKELLDYNPESGDFIWRVATTGCINAGDIAGGISLRGYVCIQIDQKIYKAHRLAWLYVYGEWPNHIDHSNHVRSDNRIHNIRNVTNKENCRNRLMTSRNTSGVVGVHWHKKNRRWIAEIDDNKKTIYLGSSQQINDAIIARKMAEQELGYHKNHGKK